MFQAAQPSPPTQSRSLRCDLNADQPPSKRIHQWSRRAVNYVVRAAEVPIRLPTKPSRANLDGSSATTARSHTLNCSLGHTPAAEAAEESLIEADLVGMRRARATTVAPKTHQPQDRLSLTMSRWRQCASSGTCQPNVGGTGPELPVNGLEHCR